MNKIQLQSPSGRKFSIGNDQPLTVIAGPCALEQKERCIEIAEVLKSTCDDLGFQYVFKASFDKANRSSLKSNRGPGIENGLETLKEIGEQMDAPVTTDIHEPHQAKIAGDYIDILQIPAFLCRQTDLLVAAAKTGKVVNVKKGQFLSPGEMNSVVDKLQQTYTAGGHDSHIMLTERGTFFGYQRLVNDFIGLGDLMDHGFPVCFDITHSTQLPGGSSQGDNRITGGRPDRAPLLARAAVAAGVQAIFLETHPDPSQSVSDGATMLPLNTIPELLSELKRIRVAIGRE